MAKKAQPIPRKDAEAMAAAVASGKRPTSPPPPKRKPRAKKPAVKPVLPDGQYNSVVWNPELNTYEVRPNKPADGFELSDFSEETKDRLREILDRKDIEAAVAASIPRWLANTFTAGVLLLIVAAISGAGVWAAGGIDVGPDAHKPDAVSAVFDAQESAFRRLSGERAKALRAGELTSEKASADWMAEKFLPESDAAWATLLTAEAEAFGGEKWTAKKEAAVVGGYAR